MFFVPSRVLIIFVSECMLARKEERSPTTGDSPDGTVKQAPSVLFRKTLDKGGEPAVKIKEMASRSAQAGKEERKIFAFDAKFWFDQY